MLLAGGHMKKIDEALVDCLFSEVVKPFMESLKPVVEGSGLFEQPDTGKLFRIDKSGNISEVSMLNIQDAKNATSVAIINGIDKMFILDLLVNKYGVKTVKELGIDQIEEYIKDIHLKERGIYEHINQEEEKGTIC